MDIPRISTYTSTSYTLSNFLPGKLTTYTVRVVSPEICRLGWPGVELISVIRHNQLISIRLRLIVHIHEEYTHLTLSDSEWMFSCSSISTCSETQGEWCADRLRAATNHSRLILVSSTPSLIKLGYHGYLGLTDICASLYMVSTQRCNQ